MVNEGGSFSHSDFSGRVSIVGGRVDECAAWVSESVLQSISSPCGPAGDEKTRLLWMLGRQGSECEWEVLYICPGSEKVSVWC